MPIYEQNYYNGVKWYMYW